MFSLLQLLDIVGSTSGIIGATLVMKMNRYGYLSLIVCNLSYGILGYMQHNYGLVLVSIVMFIIDILGWIEWSRKL